MPVAFVRSTTAPTHLGRFRTPASARGAVARPPGGAFLPDVMGPGRQAVLAAFGANLDAAPEGWTWYDITEHVQWDPGVNITIGQRDESSASVAGTQPAGFTAKLLNPEDIYTVDNAYSPWWPGVRENTPVKAVLDIGGGEYVRFFGYANGWSPEPAGSNSTAFVTLSASGSLRRLRQGKSRAKSAYERWIFDLDGDDEPHPLPIEWWPLEEAYGAETAASGLGPGHGVMRPFVGTHPSGAVVSYPRWGSGQLAPWLPAVVSRSGDAGLTILWAPVSMPAFTDEWVVEFLYNSGADAGDSGVDINPSYIGEGIWGGALGWPQLTCHPADRQVWVALNGEPEVVASVPQLFDSTVHHIRWVVYQDGGNVSWYVQLDGTYIVNSGTTSGAMTLAAIGKVALFADAQGAASLAQGHLTIWYEPGWPSSDAALGYAGETVIERMRRICRQDGVHLDVIGDSDTAMGPQPTLTFLDLAEDCRLADDGLIIDGLGPGLTMICRTSAYSLPASFRLDAAQGQFDPPRPRHDDQGRCNHFTAVQSYTNTRWTSELTTGPLAVGAVGVYDDSKTVNLHDPTDLVAYADWRIQVATPVGVRYPLLTMHLPKPSVSPLAALWLGTLPLTRIDLINMSGGPGTRRMLLRGWAERWNSLIWDVVLTLTSYEAWAVTVLALDSGDFGEFVSWFDHGDTTVASAVAVGASSISMSVNSSPLWSTAADDVPFDVSIRGIDITVTAVAGTGSPQTLTVDPADVTKALLPGDPVSVSRGVVAGR